MSPVVSGLCGFFCHDIFVPRTSTPFILLEALCSQFLVLSLVYDPSQLICCVWSEICIKAHLFSSIWVLGCSSSIDTLVNPDLFFKKIIYM